MACFSFHSEKLYGLSVSMTNKHAFDDIIYTCKHSDINRMSLNDQFVCHCIVCSFSKTYVASLNEFSIYGVCLKLCRLLPNKSLFMPPTSKKCRGAYWFGPVRLSVYPLFLDMVKNRDRILKFYI